LKEKSVPSLTYTQDDHLPIGVVSKKDVGDLKTLDNAALNRFRLAIKLVNLQRGVHEQGRYE
jgi:hypothetical protein